MAQPGGKRYLIIDLTRERYERREIRTETAARYPGSTALATYLLHANLPPGTDPLSPNSVVAFAPGMFAGMPYPGATLVGMAARSPLTGLWAGGTLGGEFAWALSRTDWDAVVLHGRARQLSYLLIDEGEVFLRNAKEIERCSCSESREVLREKWGVEAASLCVGPAGESQVRFATLEDGSSQASVRGGFGAIFGAKNLKAMTVRPHSPIRIGETEAFLEAVLPLIQALAKKEPKDLLEMDTVSFLRERNRVYALPSRNFQSACFSEDWFDSLERLDIKRRSCPGCPIACPSLPLTGKDEGTARYPGSLPLDPDPLWALGPLVDVKEGDASLELLGACREYGMDPVSLGIVAAWIAECRENKIELGIGTNWKPAFGGGAWLASLPQEITEVPEVRGLLGRGVLGASEKVDQTSRDFAMHFLGQELSFVDPRRDSWSLSFLGPAVEMVSTNDPFSSEPFSEEDGLRRTVRREDYWARMQSIGICNRLCAVREGLLQNLPVFCQFVSEDKCSGAAIDAWAVNFLNLIQAFNWRQGWRSGKLGLPRRFFEEELPTPERVYPALDAQVWQDRMTKYFASRAWSREGDPGTIEST